jgi:AcrR family transcriptional regulator
MVAPARVKPAPRRTQEERREGTIRKLLDAATETLIDAGYAEATVQAICERAGVSQGALFRHFPTREALLVAVGEDVGAKTLERYRREFAAGRHDTPPHPETLRGPSEPLVLAMRLVRTHCRSRLNVAWYELASAARTHPGLRKELEPVAARYHADIEALARDLLPELAAQLGDRFTVLVDTIVAVFDGEVVHRFLLRRPRLDDARLELLAGLAALLIQAS